MDKCAAEPLLFTVLSMSLHRLPLPCSTIAGPPTDLACFLLLPNGGSTSEDQPLSVSSRSSLSTGQASLLSPLLRIFSRGCPCSQLCSSKSISITQPEETFKSINLVLSLHYSCTLHYLQEKIQGVGCPWLTSQAALSSLNLQSHILTLTSAFCASNPLFHLGGPPALTCLEAISFP